MNTKSRSRFYTARNVKLTLKFLLRIVLAFVVLAAGIGIAVSAIPEAHSVGLKIIEGVGLTGFFLFVAFVISPLGDCFYL